MKRFGVVGGGGGGRARVGEGEGRVVHKVDGTRDSSDEVLWWRSAWISAINVNGFK